jgi:aminopeptidase N
MEHATLIAYPVATLTGTTLYQNVMAHELSHHWWGDLVTCETAEDMWINEGMARWCEALFFEQLNGYASGYMSDIRSNHKQVVWKAHVDDGAFYPISGVPQSVTYGTTTYNKGADVIHTLRGYLGDSLFFTGLQSVQNTFKFKNLNATQFRDHLNSVLPVSVTDYFNDWVFQPGFPEFAVDSLQTTGSVPSCNVKIYYKQKLRGALHYTNNVPMQVTFMDNNLHHYTARVMLGGASSNVTVTGVPFVPSLAFFNEDEKISEAVTAVEQYITTIGSKAFTNANFSMQVQNITDSVWARVEHHWVAADPFIYSNFLYTISPDRFWRVSMAGDLAHFYTKATVSYNGSTGTAGHLDNGLVAALAPFNEDSLRLLYRANAGENWQVLNTAVFTTGSKTDKTGSIAIDSLKPGDYALAVKTSAVGITEQEGKNSRFRLYPNPASSTVMVEVKQADLGHDSILIIDQQGNKVMAVDVRSAQTQLNVSGLASGVYFITLVNNGKSLGTKKLIVK